MIAAARKSVGEAVDTVRIAPWVRRHEVVIVPGMAFGLARPTGVDDERTVGIGLMDYSGSTKTIAADRTGSAPHTSRR